MELNCTIQGGSDTDVHVPQSLRGGDSSVVRALDFVIERLWVRIPAGVEGKFSSLGSTFCADSYFGICSTPTPHITAVARNDPCHSTKSAGAHGRLQLNMLAYTLRMWLCLKCQVTWCMVVWRTQNLH